MPTPVVHETVATANVAELARPEDELPLILAVLPQIPPAKTTSPTPVLEQIYPPETISPEPLVSQIPHAETINSKPPSELALDLVLNEIVLQARLTTNATGGVLGLVRSGELICRATTGATASDVAICLNVKSGIAATCFSTGASRRVDDLGPDPNADAVAYRNSGVRSILVVPVRGEIGPGLGILEIFSPRANAFCDRDVLTLQALARRIAANVELIQKSYDQRDHNPSNAQPRDSAAAEHRNSNTNTLQRAKRTQRKPPIAQFWNLTSAQRSKLASLDWVSLLAKSAIVLVLIAGSISARSCWQRSGDAKLIQLIREPMSHPPVTAVRHEGKSIVSDTAPVARQPLSVDPSTWPVRASAHSEIRPSITIQREPVHMPKQVELSIERSAVAPAPNGNVVLFDDHKSIAKNQIALQSRLSSKDPADSVLPNKAAGDQAGPEVLPTQAAMARLVQRVEPEYPNAARQQHIQGTVLIDVIVDATGAVEALSLVSGESQLMAAAEQAVRQWKFQPLMKDGKAEKFESRIAIDFTLAFEGSSGTR